MVAAKVDQSRVLVTKFRENRLTLKGRSAGQRQTHTQTDKPVGFYGPIALPVPNAPSSECPELQSLHAAALPVQSEYPAERHAAAAVPFAGIAIGADFKIYLLRQFCWNWVKIFSQYTGDTEAKNDGPDF